jgi:hypothetical protein
VETVRGSGHFLEEKSMSFVTTKPEMLSTAAGDSTSIGSALSTQNAAVPPTGVVSAGADEVSALMAARFTAHAQQLYLAISAQATAIHDQFVATEALNAMTDS